MRVLFFIPYAILLLSGIYIGLQARNVQTFSGSDSPIGNQLVTFNEFYEIVGGILITVGAVCGLYGALGSEPTPKVEVHRLEEPKPIIRRRRPR